MASRMNSQENNVSDPKPQVDDALKFLRNHGETVSMTSTEEKDLVRKIDWMLMPLMAVVYNLQYLDKTILNYANVMGISKDTHTNASQFSYLAMVFYVSYLFCEVPHGYLIQKLPIAKYLGACVALWGLVVTLNCASTNYASLVALRVLLGCFEAVVPPSLVLITSMWYKKSEQAMRVGIWFGTSGIAVIVGALSSYGFQHYHGILFTSWQIMFLVCGIITMFFGILVILFLPDNPMTSRLSNDEKLLAIERLRSNKTGIENKKFNRAQLIEALTDRNVWIIVVLMITSSEINGALSNYQASIIKSFGFTSKQSALLSVPSGAIAILVCFSSAWIAGRSNQRLLTLMGYFPLGIVGAALMAFPPPEAKVAKMVGQYMSHMVPSTPIVYTIAAANFSGHTKKITVNALILISFSIGNIIGPLTFTGETAPDFIPAKIAMMACFSGSFCLTFLLRCSFAWENRKRDRAGEESPMIEDSEFLNLTDRENKGFRYSL